MSTRQQAPRLARPAARYWKGKAPKGVVDIPSDSDEDEAPEVEEGDVLISGEQDIVEEDDSGVPIRKDPLRSVKAMNVSLKDVNISKDGKVTVAGRDESGRTAMEVDESDENESEEDEKPIIAAPSEESSEYETDSDEEEEKHKPQFRPVFVPKRSRVTVLEKEAIAQDTEEALRKKELEAEERRKQSHDLVAESIRRELAEKEKDEIIPDIDDTDGLDPAAEFEAWRLRELGRIKKEKEEEIRREEEREEVERRRAMPEEQRMKEDLEKAQKSRDEKPKGQAKFLQKYWHKGAFHQDEEILKRHDFTQATESTVDVSMLPQVMQVKNFGKRSRTKYTHLLDQDTTAKTGGFGGTALINAGGKSAGGGCFTCGGPHLKKECPQNTGPLTQRGFVGTGANAAPTSPRQRDAGPNTQSWRDRNHDRPRDSGWGDSRKPRNGDRHARPRVDDTYSSRDVRDQRRGDNDGRDYYDDRGNRRHSRSRSPYRDSRRNDNFGAKDGRRSRSPELSVSHDREKRRRID